MADSRVGAGKVQDSLEHFVCQKAKKCSQNEEDMFKKNKQTQKWSWIGFYWPNVEQGSIKIMIVLDYKPLKQTEIHEAILTLMSE